MCYILLLSYAALLGLLWALVEQQAEVYRFYRRLGLEDAA